MEKIKTLKPAFIFLFFLVCLTGYHSLSIFFPGHENWIYQIFAFLVPALIVIFLFLPDRKHSLYSSRLNIKCIIGIIGLSILVSVLVHLLSALLHHFYPIPDDLIRKPGNILSWQNSWPLLTVCLIPALCEEIFFRGFIQNSLRKIWGTRIAIIVTAILFAIAHLNAWQFPFYLILGIYFGWCQSFRNNLLYPIIAHSINNIVALLFLTQF